jgi:branched-chain amino acid transport system ATP-binding protein
MLLEVSNLRVDYHKVPAVRGLNLRIAEKEVVCMVGPNGAGKSTTTMTIAGVKRPTAGQILLDGVDISRATPEAVAAMGVSLVPEGRRIFGRMSVRENLLVGAPLARRGGQQGQSLDRMYDLFPILGQRQNQAAGQLSGGEQQQLTSPRLLIVDEPSLGLAPQFVDLVFGTFTRLRDEGVTILVVEQSSKRALALADRLYLLRSGGVVMEGPVDELTENAAFEAAYFGEVGTR